MPDPRYRTGRRISVNIYDGDEIMGQAQTSEYAHRIVAALNRLEAPAGPGVEKLPKLSVRQRQVFDYLVLGMSTKEIAVRLGVATKTVETHRTILYRRLRVHGAVELLRLAMRTGDISP